jgi:hypothetical protein
MVVPESRLQWSLKPLGLTLALSALLTASQNASAGTWTPLAHTAPGPISLMLLLPDGTVMANHQNGSTIGINWYLLTPDSAGSYVNGTWTTLAPMHDTRLYFQSQVLRDGRVYVSGGEYGTGGPKAEVYDPMTNLWTVIAPPASLWNPSTDNFYDCNLEMLPDGKVLLMPVFPHGSGNAIRYDPATNLWSSGGHLAHGSYQDEASWVKLPDDSILTIDPFGTLSERYIPASNTWIADSNVPVSLYDPFGSELGGAVLLPSGKAFFLGSTGKTALYTPTGTTSPGTWVAGPDIPGAHGTPDAPACMMVNGKVLCAVSPIPTSGNHFPSPTTFYEYDWVSNSFASVGAPTGASEPGATYGELMLQLPDGTVLFSHFSAQIHSYQPSGVPLAQGKPAITSIVANGDGSYHLVGTQLNGISEGATYGDDWQMNTNYPLVRLSDGLGGVYYARTYAWSSTGVMTGATPVSTEFVPPASLPPGNYSLVVVANGIASDAVNFPPSTAFSGFCYGDGTAGLCPCLNFGLSGRGCENSASTGGAVLAAAGNASLAADTVQFTATGELPSALSIFSQGQQVITPVVFGDGLRCVNVNLKRLYTKSAVGGTAIAPTGGDPTVSARSAALGDTITSGSSRYYYTYYRDPSAAFCADPPGNTFNITTSVGVAWGQ